MTIKIISYTLVISNNIDKSQRKQNFYRTPIQRQIKLPKFHDLHQNNRKYQYETRIKHEK